MVERFEKFSYFISELSRLLHKIESEEMEVLGLKGTHSIYLIVLARFKGGITATELAKICGRDKADVSRAISALDEKSLIKKEASGKNNYRASLTLTDAGLSAAARLRARARLAVEYASAGVSDEDRAALYRSLEAICKNIQSLSEVGIPKLEDINGAAED